MTADIDTTFVIEGQLVRDAFGSYVNFIRYLLNLKEDLAPGQSYRWSQNFQNTAEITKPEIEQIFGLLGSVDNIAISNKQQNKHNITVEGRVRIEKIGVLLCWTRPALHHVDASQLILETLNKNLAILKFGLHVIDLDYNDGEQHIWETNVKNVIEWGKKCPEKCYFGVSFSIPKFRDINYIERIGYIKKLIKRFKLEEQFIFQVVNGAPQVADSRFILDFAAQNGFSFDFSLLNNIDNGNLQSYFQHGAYYPLDFDLRAKAPISDSNIIEFPRISGNLLIDEVWVENLYYVNQKVATLKKYIYDNHYEAVAKQLILATESYISDAYDKIVNFDINAVNMWEKYSIFNWSPPQVYDLRLIEFNAASINYSNSSLNRALKSKLIDSDDPVFCLGYELLAYAKAQAALQSSSTINDNLIHQVSGHDYLHEGGRPDISADSHQLLAILPEKLGLTLELGCGYGVLAKHILCKCSQYMGVDLAFEQVRSITELNACGLQCDMHRLCFQSGVFNTILADNVIEHSYDPLGLLKELYRVLVDGGSLYALIPCDLFSSNYQLRLHLWKSDPESVKVAVNHAGFELVDLRILDYTRINGYGSFPASKDRTCLLHCRKLSLKD